MTESLGIETTLMIVIVLLFTLFDNLFLIIYLIEKKSIHFVEIIF